MGKLQIFIILHLSLFFSSLSGVLKHVPLTLAYANKPVSLVWGMVWGAIFFGEGIRFSMILGALIIFAGICLVVTSDE